MKPPAPQWHIEAMSAATQEVAALCRPAPRGGSWVSVIEPDAQLREALRRSLSGVGAEVRTYEAAEPFLAQLPSGLPVCLITEVALPAMSGLTLLRHLKALRRAVPTIFLATRPEVALAVEAIREGALDFIEKPYVDSRIVGSVAAILET